jgi:hypothetical protein
MLSNLFTFVKAKGSSLSLPAHGWVGARATSFLAAHFAKQNTNSVGVQSEGEAEGGCGGNSASPEPKRSPAALLVKSRPQKKSFVFLLKEKIGRAQIKNCEQNFSLSERALASGGGAERQNSAFGFSLKKVRISFSVRSKFILANFVMNKGRIIYSILVILSGIFLFVYGGYDDSPGGQMLGLVAIVAGIIGIIKSKKKILTKTEHN